MTGLVVTPASYPLLDPGLFSVEYAEVLARPYVAGVNNNLFVDLGQVEYFKHTLTVTSKEVYSKNQPFSQVIFSAPVKLDAKIAMKAMQKLDLVRGWAMSGNPDTFTQGAVANGSLVIPSVPATGGILPLGVIGGTVTGVFLSAAPGTTAVAAGDWSQVDQGFTAISFIPGAGCAGESVTVEFTAPAYTATEVAMGTNPLIDVEVFVRGMSSIGKKGVLHIPRWRAVPKGDLDWISQNDDISGYEFEGRAFPVNLTTLGGSAVQATGIWTQLPG